MKKLIFFIFLVTISNGKVITQTDQKPHSLYPGITWQQTIGGSGREYGTCIINALDLGFAATGYTNSTGSGLDDALVVKLSSDAELQWGAVIGGVKNDIANSLIQTSDSCFIFVGATNSVSLDFYEDMFIAKLNVNGELLWSKIFGTTGWDIAYSIKQTNDGGYIVAGYSSLTSTRYGILLVKFREDDTVEWSKFVENVGLALLYPEVIQTSDDGYCIATTADSVFGGQEMCLIKLNKFGLLQWSWAIGGTSIEEAVSVCQTGDNGYALSGYTVSYGAGAPDLYIAKISSTGTLQWTRTIGGDNDDYAFSILNADDGGLIVAGESFTYGLGEIDMYIIKLDASGKYLWGKTIGRSEFDFIRSIIHDYDGGYVAIGRSGNLNTSDVFLAKIDSFGNSCGYSTVPVPHIDSGGSIIKYPVVINNMNITLNSVNPGMYSWGSISKLCLTGSTNNSGSLPEKFSLHQNYPNPFNPVTKIKFDIPASVETTRWVVSLIIYNIQGTEVAVLVNEQLKPGSYSVDWDGTAFASGVYFYSLVTDGFVETKRMVLVK